MRLIKFCYHSIARTDPGFIHEAEDFAVFSPQQYKDGAAITSFMCKSLPTYDISSHSVAVKLARRIYRVDKVVQEWSTK